MTDFPFKPRVVGWELTLRCNMRCLHCGSSAGLARADELTVEEGLSLIDQLADLGAEVITLSGGEPMTHPAWDRYARRCLEHGIRTYMITNGLLLEENVEKLVDAGLKRLGISLDGSEPTHNRIRNHPDSFARMMAGARKAREAGIKVGAVTHISGANLGELEAMYDVVKAAGMSFWQIQLAFSQGRMREHAEFTLDPNEVPRVVRFVHAKQQLNELQVVAGDNLGYYGEPEIRKVPWKGCFAGRHLIGIDADGSVKGCLSQSREFVQGNIRTEPLRKIWEDPDRFRFNRYFSRDMLAGHCKDCPKAEPCRAGCVTLAHASTGNRFDNPYCNFRIQRELAGRA